MRFYCLWSWLRAEITIYSPPVTVTMARKGRALSTEAPLQPFPCTAFTSHGCHGDQQNEHDCTVRQTCRKGRRDVLFLPHYGFHSAVSEALNFSITDPLVWLSSSTCRGMCKHTERKVLPRREIPASGVCWISTLSEVLIAKCHSVVFLIASSLTSSLLAHTCVNVLQWYLYDMTHFSNRHFWKDAMLSCRARISI